MIVPFSERTRTSKTIFAMFGLLTQATRSSSHCGRTIRPSHQKGRHLTERTVIALSLSSIDLLRSKATWHSKVLGGPSPKHFPREDKKPGFTVRWSRQCLKKIRVHSSITILVNKKLKLTPKIGSVSGTIFYKGLYPGINNGLGSSMGPTSTRSVILRIPMLLISSIISTRTLEVG